MGDLISDRERLRQVDQLYEAATFGGDRTAPARAERVLDGLAADLALARGKTLHARYLTDRKEVVEGQEGKLFQQAVTLYRALGDVRGEGEALFWLGAWHQVVREAYGEAVPCFQRSYELAESAGDRLTQSYAARHLGFAAEAAGHLDEARARFEQSVHLREDLGLPAAAAAAQLALAEFLWHSCGDHHTARQLLDQAHTTATQCGAAGVLQWIADARTRM
ncbi:tetratricopeptide repeat protein [Streptomyces sp. NBC_00448]|uniref:tetratricopeptide repeat protein n=1 Tax=Streptomyces sp. NBC_00448 TaxID=2903652 RepID=UPI002E223B77